MGGRVLRSRSSPYTASARASATPPGGRRVPPGSRRGPARADQHPPPPGGAPAPRGGPGAPPPPPPRQVGKRNAVQPAHRRQPEHHADGRRHEPPDGQIVEH